MQILSLHGMPLATLFYVMAFICTHKGFITMNLKVAIISGSHRPSSQSLKVANFIATQLASRGIDFFILDLGTAALPLWDEGLWGEEADHWNTAWTTASKQVGACDAVILISPEYSGMASPSLKNFLLLCEKGELEHKPALIVGVSTGLGGTYPVAELRMSSFKNTNICYVPGHVIIRNVGKTLNSIEPENDGDRLIRQRLEHALAVLSLYASALKIVRQDDLITSNPFPYGM